MDIYLDHTIPSAERSRLQKLLREAFADPARRAKLEATKGLLRQLGGDENDLFDTVAEQAAQRVENWREGGVSATAEDVGEIVDGILDSLQRERQQTVAAAERQQAVAQALAQQRQAQAPSVKPGKPAVKLPQQPAALDSQRRALEARIKEAAPEAARQFLAGGRAAVPLELSSLRELRT